jgi:tetratricopeptide (TPR) repeat protein
VEANQLFQQGKYVEARDRYESIVRNGYVSGELFYNLGNTYYKTGNIGRAILNYERAQRHIPGDDDLRHNLQLANLVITDKIESTPRLFIWDAWDTLKGMMSVDTLTWLVYGVYLVLLGLVATFFFSTSYGLKRFALLSCIAVGTLLVFTAVLLAARIDDVTRTDAAIVLVDITTLKNSPDANSTDAFVLHAGVKVTITDSVNEWMKVRLADGKVAWMEKASAEVI